MKRYQKSKDIKHRQISNIKRYKTSEDIRPEKCSEYTRHQATKHKTDIKHITQI